MDIKEDKQLRSKVCDKKTGSEEKVKEELAQELHNSKIKKLRKMKSRSIKYDRYLPRIDGLNIYCRPQMFSSTMGLG